MYLTPSGRGGAQKPVFQPIPAQNLSQQLPAQTTPMDLGKLSKPKITQMTGDSLELQQEIMGHLNEKILKVSEHLRDDVYRICSVELIKENGNIRLEVTPPTQIPKGLADGTGLLLKEQGTTMVPDENLKNAIASNVATTLEQSGQFEYLRTNGMFDDARVKVDVDFYFQRPPDAVGFHKDTTGRTMFVNLNFNNQSEMLGPEYVLNPSLIPSHEQHVATKLHPQFQAQLNKQRSLLGQPTTIEATKVPPNGVVSFVDELIHHSTPYPDHRGITNAQVIEALDKYDGKFCQELRTAKHFIDIYDSEPTTNIVTAKNLQTIGLPEQDIAFLMQGKDQISVADMRVSLNNDSKLVQMRAQVAPFINLTQRVDTVKRHELVASGMPESEVNAIFTALKKPNMEVVSTAHCEDDCHLDTKSAAELLDRLKDGTPLHRKMSADLNNGVQLPVSDKNRQFFRTWVQLFEKA